MAPEATVGSDAVHIEGSFDNDLSVCGEEQGASASHCTYHVGNAHCYWITWIDSTCDMQPHCPYFPANHGYYYFRPYHHSHIAAHQASVASWGGDRRNPYSNAIFSRIYAEYDAARSIGAPPSAPTSQNR